MKPIATLAPSLFEELESWLQHNPERLAILDYSPASPLLDITPDQSEAGVNTPATPTPATRTPVAPANLPATPANLPATPAIPKMASSLSLFRADFKFCGFFSGKDISAAKWLKKLDWELEGYAANGIIPPHRYIQALDLLLTEDAAAWAESHLQAISILASPNPTTESVKNFKNLLTERFPAKSSEVLTISFDTELSELKQHDESLSAYYKRLLAIMQRVGARDRPTQISESSPMLSMLEEAMLESVMKAFLRGLANLDIRHEATRAVAGPDRSLRGAYTLAEEARRTKAEIQKLNDEEYKTKENKLLRSILRKTISKS